MGMYGEIYELNKLVCCEGAGKDHKGQFTFEIFTEKCTARDFLALGDTAEDGIIAKF